MQLASLSSRDAQPIVLTLADFATFDAFMHIILKTFSG
jgi:hypothetical protein